MSILLNRVKQQISSPTGTGGPLVLASTAYSNAYATIAAAGGVDGSEVCYVVEEGLDWEIQRGVWSSSPNSLVRNTPIMSSVAGSISTAKMSLAGAATIRVIADADEFSYLRQIRGISAATDTILDAHKGTLTLYNRSSAIAVGVGSPSSSAFHAGWNARYKNINTGIVTFTISGGATLTTDGVSSSTVSLAQYETLVLWSDGTNLYGMVIRQSLWLAMSRTVAEAAQARVNINAAPAGYVNKLRNSSLTSWFHGSGSLTVTTGAAWGAEGIYIVPTGASVTASQQANSVTNPRSLWCQRIVGNTSVTGLTTRFTIASEDAAALAGQRVCFQIPVKNSTGGTINPTITVKHPSAADNYTSSTTDVSAQALGSLTTGSDTVFAYAWDAPAGSNLGISITVDWGNNFSTNGKFIEIGGGFDCRAYPAPATGVVTNPPIPEVRDAQSDIAWNQRFFEASYDNGLTPGAVSTNGESRSNLVDGLSSATRAFTMGVQYITPKRAVPTVTLYSPSSGASGQIRNIAASADTSGSVGESGMRGFGISATLATSTFINVTAHWTADCTIPGA